MRHGRRQTRTRAGRLLSYQPDVIFAEPVGSCIDIAATTLRPLGALHGGYTLRLSARTGEGVAAWLKEILDGSRLAANRTLAVDYSVCADAEAALFAPPSRRHELLVNLRAKAAPEQLRQAIEQAAAKLPGKVSVAVFECFRPAPPKPEHRMG